MIAVRPPTAADLRPGDVLLVEVLDVAAHRDAGIVSLLIDPPWNPGHPLPVHVAADTPMPMAGDVTHAAGREPDRGEDVAAEAKWLAEQSGSPRFGPQGLGWAALLRSEANVEFAHASARRRAEHGGVIDPADLTRLNRARDALIAHARDARP